jgi:transposase-like protein
MSHPALFKWKHFQPEIILLNVRCYCRYALSYWDLKEMMAERGLSVDHSTINRWVLPYPDIVTTPNLTLNNVSRQERSDCHSPNR